MKQIGIIALSVILILTLSFCGKKETPQEKAQKEAAKAMEQFTKSFGGQTGQSGSSDQAANPFAEMQKATEKIRQQSEAQQGGKITAADRDTLLAAMPNVSGWNQGEPRYSKGGYGNIEVSDIQSDYAGGDEQPVHIKIQDTATMSSLIMPLKMVMQMNITQENDNGYEKVGNFNGMPIIEKWEKDRGRAEITFIVKDRYIIYLDTQAKGGAKLLEQFASTMKISELK